MKVINRLSASVNGNKYVTYTFDTGHEFRQWNSGSYFGYTPKGNYASQTTTNKLARIASEYEDERDQIE